jgi:pSer/pThr/pTyr-binding forkhead associated (FHA) protein
MSKRLQVKKQDLDVPEIAHEVPSNGIITVGSDAVSTIRLKDQNIAEEQFVIVCEEDKMTLLSRANGNRVNGDSLAQGALHILDAGDTIAVGEFTIFVASDEINQNSSKNGNSKPKKSAKKANSGGYKLSENADGEPEEIHMSLSGVLAELRTEEKFYFEISNALGETRRAYVEEDDMLLGWSKKGDCNISLESDDLTLPLAKINKDWTGVILNSLKPKSVWVNNEIVGTPRRLKNDDKISIADKDSKKPSMQCQVKFHEPTALLVLDSILPKELPPPILLDENGKPVADEFQTSLDGTKQSNQIPAVAKKSKGKRLFFGYFTLTEIIIMTIGTLITAIIVFLILELY